MKPKISTFYPFDYEQFLSEAKFMFIGRCGNNIRPQVVIKETEDRVYGHSISTYNNGIELNSYFSCCKSLVDVSTLTTHVNEGICEWLKDVDHTLIEN